MPRPPLAVGTWGKVARREVTPGRWRATARFRDFDGRTRQVEAWGSSGAKAERALLASLTYRAVPTGDDVAADTRVDVLGTMWLADVEHAGRLRPQSVEDYRAIVERAISPTIGGLRLREVTPGRVDHLLKGVSRTHPAKARQVRTVLRAMFALAVRRDAIPSNPVDGSQPVTLRRTTPRALTVDELDALRAGVRAWQEEPGQRGPKRADDLLDVVDVMLGTGARIGEVLAIRWQDVDLSTAPATVTISGTLVHVKGEGLRRQPAPKTAAGWRVVSLPRFAADVLLRRSVSAEPNPHDVVFPSTSGTLRWPNNFQRQWRDARQSAGFEWVTPHHFRKTVATIVERELGLKDASVQLGHSGTAVTQAHYVERAHRAPDVSTVLDVLRDRSVGRESSESVG